MSLPVKISVEELPKSPLPAGYASESGSYLFFVSGPKLLKCDNFLIDGEAVVFSTGGNAAVHYGKGKFSYSTDCWALKPLVEQVNGMYLYYFLSSQIHRIDALGFVGSGLRHLRKNFIREYEVPDFPKSEQAKIAEVLSTVDRAIEQTEDLIAKQQRIKIGLMQDLLTRGIDEHGNLRSEETHEFKDSPLGRIPVEWEEKTLSELADVDRGKFTHRPRNDPRFYGGEFPFIQTGDITSRIGRKVVSYTQTLNERGTKVSKEFAAETIAITIAANIADTAILSTAMYFPDSIVGVVVKKPNNTRFVELMIRQWKPILERLAPQSAQKNINLETLRPLAIPTPSIDEQNVIGDLYETVELEQERIEQHLGKLRRLKTALMQDLLTGKVRVTPLLTESLQKANP